MRKALIFSIDALFALIIVMLAVLVLFSFPADFNLISGSEFLKVKALSLSQQKFFSASNLSDALPDSNNFYCHEFIRIPKDLSQNLNYVKTCVKSNE